MTNTPVFRSSASAPTAFAPISETPLTVSGTLTARPGNTGTIVLRHNETADEATIYAGGSHSFVRVDLSQIQIKGSAASQGYDFIGDNDRGLR